MTIGDTRARNDFAVLGDLAPHEARPVSSVSNRQPARRQRPQRAVQLGFRQALRRNVRPQGGGHRRWTQPRGVIPGAYDSLTWLGLTWDEGPLVGGPYGPYIQHERGDVHRDVVTKLAAKLAYRCYCTREEIEAREAARPVGAASGYDGFCRNLGEQRIAVGSHVDAISRTDAGA